MSITNNAYLPLVAAALAATLGAPVVEKMLDNVAVTGIKAVEISDAGKCIVCAEIGGVLRPVTSTSGDVKLYTDAASVFTLAKASNLPAGSSVEIIKRAKTVTMTDPVSALKSKYRKAVSEQATATDKAAELASKVAAAIGGGWNTDEAYKPLYDDFVARKATVDEWVTATDDAVTTLAAALTAANIDPATVV